MKVRLHDRRPVQAWEADAEFASLAQRICAPVGLPEWQVDLVLVDDDEMSDLNRRYRDREGLTDVLSFSYLEPAGAGDYALAAGVHHAACDLWRDPLDAAAGSAVGEIVLAVDFVGRRCRERGLRFRDELALLIAHGALHLLGWEHADEAAAAAMRVPEQELLSAVGVDHPLLEKGG